MSGPVTITRQRLHAASLMVLLAGLGSAIAINIAADDEESGASYEIVGGKICPNVNKRSKKYIHDLELRGGKAAVLADDSNRCIAVLWRGRTLAETVAVLCTGTSLVLYAAARLRPSGD